MPKYIIERELPGAGKLSAAELKGIARKSCAVLDSLGPKIQWIESYVTEGAAGILPAERAVTNRLAKVRGDRRQPGAGEDGAHQDTS